MEFLSFLEFDHWSHFNFMGKKSSLEVLQKSIWNNNRESKCWVICVNVFCSLFMSTCVCAFGTTGMLQQQMHTCKYLSELTLLLKPVSLSAVTPFVFLEHRHVTGAVLSAARICTDRDNLKRNAHTHPRQQKTHQETKRTNTNKLIIMNKTAAGLLCELIEVIY